MENLMGKTEPAIPTEQQIKLAAESSRALSTFFSDNQETPVFELKLKDDKKPISIRIPATALQMLFSILTEMSQGNAITLIPVHAELTTQEAANILNISRPYLIGLLEEGKIPYRQVGNRKKVLFKDLIEYKQAMYQFRKQVLAELSAEGQALEHEFQELKELKEAQSHKTDNKDY